ncbi:MAG: tRNA epoxyqueuosine(34) reductase QueG [Bacteroidales bacterium]|jgi:epoxyqueuosine reductase|nr:tRNA epoxyqueuosine(34) reductase QueG [Bacteroidales bacterium]
MTIGNSEKLIKEKAIALGFTACGITRCKSFEKESIALDSWLQNEYHSDMHFMTRYKEKRKNPVLLHKDVKSVIVLLINYRNPDYIKNKQSNYVFAEYALGKDYHFVIKEKLQKLSDFLTTMFGPSDNSIYVDSAPIFEKAFAVEAGLGWIGKNTLLINSKGSRFLIGELFTNLDLCPDEPCRKSGCENCNKCVDACPTNALIKPYVLNTRRCLSYQSIERKQITWNDELKPFISKYIFGCDICQRVCPYNQQSEPTKVPEFKIKNELLSFSDNQWETLSESDFNRIFVDSPVHRLGYRKFMENIFTAKETLSF